MPARSLIPAAAALTLCASNALAQEPGLSEGIHFTLKPRASVPLLPTGMSSAPVARSRRSRLGAMPAHDRALGIEIIARRRNLGLVGSRHLVDEAPAPDFAPRSRFTLVMLQDRLPLGKDLTITAGVQGAKISNRGANVTAVAGNDRIRARDWFMPQATVEFTPLPKLDIALGYRETLRAFGETGLSGPMGLPQEEFRAWSRTSRPETHSRLRIDAHWAPAPGTNLTLIGYEGQLRDRLAFIPGAYQARNGGSAQLTGWRFAISQALSHHWRLSLRYGAGIVDQAGGPRARENSASLEANWNDGRWSGSVRGTRTSLPALSPDAGRGNRPLRMEGEIRYRMTSIGRARTSLSLRLADPDQLATTEFLRDDPAGPSFAADQARSLMLGVGLNW